MNIRHDRVKALESGFQLFWANGYNKLGVDEICRTTGMTKGAFYNAFKSKENFLLLCIEAYGVMNVTHLSNELNHANAKAVDRILSLYTNMFAMQPKKNYIGCMLGNTMSEMGSANELVSTTTARVFERLLTVLEPVVQEAQRAGDLNPAIPSKALTELLHTTFFGALTRIKSTKDCMQGATTMTILIKSLKTI